MPDVSAGYLAGPGGYYRASDRSGPYVIDGNGVATLLELSSQPVDTIVRSVATYAGGTIAAANTAQPFLAVNTNRRGFTIQNQSTGDLYIKIGGTATISAASLKIKPDQLYESSPQHVSTGAISVIGAVAGQAFYGTEF